MLTVVLYLLLTLLVILVILVGSLFLPWKFGLTGELASAPEKFTGTGSATIGANTCGISVKLQKELVIGIGPYNNPWLKKSIKPNKSKQKTVKEKPSTKKKSKTLPIGFYKNLIKSTISRVHWHRLNLQGQINFQNPMKTGITMGLIQWLKMIKTFILHQIWVQWPQNSEKKFPATQARPYLFKFNIWYLMIFLWRSARL